MEKIFILGVGPGNPRYVLPITREIAASCDVLIGGTRNLSLFDDLERETIGIKGDIQPVIDFIKVNYTKKKIAVLVSGDPGFFSMLHTLKRYFDDEVLEVVPGISSIQYFFSKIRIPWNDAVILSLHGRKQDELVRLVKENPKVGMFTDSKNTPAAICSLLYQEGISNKKVYIGENLSYDDERIHKGNLSEMCTIAVQDMNVMVIADE